LEGLGSGGAIWGISEVLTLRTTPTSLLFRLLAGGVSFGVSAKLLIHFYDRYTKLSPPPQSESSGPHSDSSTIDDEESIHMLSQHSVLEITAAAAVLEDEKQQESLMDPTFR
jgi:hypothetical protein